MSQDQKEPELQDPGEGVGCVMLGTPSAPSHQAFGQKARKMPTALPQGPGSPEGRRAGVGGRLLTFPEQLLPRNLEPHVFLRFPNKLLHYDTLS